MIWFSFLIILIRLPVAGDTNEHFFPFYCILFGSEYYTYSVSSRWFFFVHSQKFVLKRVSEIDVTWPELLNRIVLFSFGFIFNFVCTIHQQLYLCIEFLFSWEFFSFHSLKRSFLCLCLNGNLSETKSVCPSIQFGKRQM